MALRNRELHARNDDAGQEVKGKGHTRPRLDLETSLSAPFGQVAFLVHAYRRLDIENKTV